jgi:hypothetical protein
MKIQKALYRRERVQIKSASAKKFDPKRQKLQ